MQKGLQLNGDEIVFQKWDTGEISIGMITNSFKIPFDEIRLIVLSPRLAFDDEMLLISIIDKNKKFYQFSDKELAKKPLFEIEKRLELKNPIHIEYQKFSWEQFENCFTDKIIFPNDLYWENLFIEPKGLKRKIIRFFKFFSFKRSKTVRGRFNPKVLNFFK